MQNPSVHVKSFGLAYRCFYSGYRPLIDIFDSVDCHIGQAQTIQNLEQLHLIDDVEGIAVVNVDSMHILIAVYIAMLFMVLVSSIVMRVTMSATCQYAQTWDTWDINRVGLALLICMLGPSFSP